MEEDKLEFKEQEKIVKLKEFKGGHWLVKLEHVGNDNVFLAFQVKQPLRCACEVFFTSSLQ